jgi:hypothetical protein
MEPPRPLLTRQVTASRNPATSTLLSDIFRGMPLDFIAGYVLGSQTAGRAGRLASSASRFSGEPTSRLHDLNERLDRVVLVMEAMWSLMEEQGMTEDDLRRRIQELDATDGVVDGRKVEPAGRCPSCEAAVGRGAGICQFCGHEFRDANPFNDV